MTKVAIAAEKNQVSQHFGHCEAFVIFLIDGEKVTDKKVVPNPGHKPGFLPVFLAEQGVHVIISGGMGAGAVEIFNEHGIVTIIGASGEIDSVIESYLKGNLTSTNVICNHNHDYA